MIKVAALLMAAGNSRRMGGPNKLLLPFRNVALITFAARAVRQANFSARLMVTGRDGEITGEFGRQNGFDVIHNPSFETGFGSSLSAGFSALLKMPDVRGAIVMLADMPMITAAHLNALIEAFDQVGGHAIIRAANDGHPGNPVLIPRPLFVQMAGLKGEESGNRILPTSGFPLRLIETGIASIADIDTPDELAILQEALR